MRPARILPAVVTALLLALPPAPGLAADPPCLTARLIVPWGSGSGTDVIFRALADAANAGGAKPRLEVVNVSGEEGVRGSREARRARPDGCTLLAIHQSLMTSFIAGHSDFNWTDFSLVGRLTRTPVVVAARAEAPFATLGEMLEAARGPEGIKVGSTQGLSSHFLYLLIADRTGATFNQTFLEGAREQLTALLAGKIDSIEINVATTRRLVPDGLLKPLAFTGPKRSPELPDVPTLREEGVDLVFAIDRGVVLPKGADPALVDRYATVFEKALTSPAVVNLLNENGTDVGFLPPKAYAGYWQDSFAEWRRIAKGAGIYNRSD